ncbi:MAG TPA: DinB family protein [Candidatus Angelobacter sp.]|nr:DinB family protein [Candidatus Angelobacter sp.]
MSDVHATAVRDFTRYYQQCAEKIHALVDPLTDEQIWARPYSYGNSIGHLLLHLTGNLSYYIGAEIGGIGYVRNRPLEFSDTARHPKATLLKNFDVAIATVIATLQKQSEDDWDAPFAGKGLESAGNRFYAFLQCAGHLSHHTGQMTYLCKEMEHSKR